MRFNDQLQTILAARPDSDSGIVTLWRQCVDLLAQHDRPGWDGLEPRHRDALLERLKELRSKVSERQRIATVVDLGGRLRSPTLIRFFAEDRPAITVAALSRARLPDLLWPGLIPMLSSVGRGALRNRRDLGEATRRALDAYGATDLTLPSAEGVPVGSLYRSAAGPEPRPVSDEIEPASAQPEPVAAEPVTTEPIAAKIDGSIRDIVERIQSYTAAKRERSEEAKAPLAIDSFDFVTDADGMIADVEGAPRGALVGLSIADAPEAGESGPDGYAVGAFRRRGPFTYARFTLVDGGALEGEWRISGMPQFDADRGRFLGYRGEARRPQLVEMPAIIGHGRAHTDTGESDAFAPDAIRQLVHELRTPLNAIMGFAEIIQQQMFGPTPDDYRGLAANIVADSRKLLVAFDDLDLATRMSRGDVEMIEEPVEISAVARDIAGRFTEEGHPVTLLAGEDAPGVWMDAGQAERMVQSLLRTLVAVTAAGERLFCRCARAEGEDGEAEVSLAVDRPLALAGISERDLLDPGYGPDGNWPDAPLMGVGFSLRLVRSIAEGAGGRLSIGDGRFELRLPARLRPADDRADEKGQTLF